MNGVDKKLDWDLMILLIIIWKFSIFGLGNVFIKSVSNQFQESMLYWIFVLYNVILLLNL